MKNISLDIFVCILLLLWKVPRLSGSTYQFFRTLNLDPVCLTESWCNIEKINMGPVLLWCLRAARHIFLARSYGATERTVFQGDWKKHSRWNLKLKLSKSDLVGWGCCADGFQKRMYTFSYYTSFWGFEVPKKTFR